MKANKHNETCLDYQSKLIDWEQRRYEIAREMLANCWNDGQEHGTDEAVSASINMADRLIKQLKEKEETK